MDVGQVYVNAIELQNSVLRYIIAVFFIVMIAGIVNTMLMSVFERIREVGTMMAIGVRRKRILAMFLFEAMTLGSMGALAGLIFGGGFVLLTGRVGFPMPSIGDAEAYTVYPYVAPSYMLTVMGIALVTAVIAALYPALRASRLRPAEALRTM
jgi:putative ABC transport system permease protein